MCSARPRAYLGQKRRQGQRGLEGGRPHRAEDACGAGVAPHARQHDGVVVVAVAPRRAARAVAAGLHGQLAAADLCVAAGAGVVDGVVCAKGQSRGWTAG